ncbi:MAG: hydrogenase expression/formation protein HypE [Thermoprotei archaeon]|nr:MAG: hydrogenase expression/formation protein HypE [Thermoprotei archaeon]
MHEKITLAHGSGGVEMQDLIEKLILTKFKPGKVGGGVGLIDMEDSATIPLGDVHVVVTMDSYTVNPIFFPGGDIGKLAITGTINDLVVKGAKPLAIMDSIVVEEGFSVSELNRILDSMRKIVKSEGIALIGGDFKVMPRGSLDQIVISTVGIGIAKANELLLDSNVKPGDAIIITGTIGEHGAVIMALQSGIDVSSTTLRSDCEPLTKVMNIVVGVGGVHAAKDPTRGGLAMALNEMAKKSGVTIVIEEDKVPIRDEVKAYCEMLGIDPLVLACEGRALLAVSSDRADDIVEALRSEGYVDACIIGKAVQGRPGYVLMRTSIGGLVVVEPPRGEIVPRIC